MLDHVYFTFKVIWAVVMVYIMYPLWNLLFKNTGIELYRISNITYIIIGDDLCIVSEKNNISKRHIHNNVLCHNKVYKKISEDYEIFGNYDHIRLCNFNVFDKLSKWFINSDGKLEKGCKSSWILLVKDTITMWDKNNNEDITVDHDELWQ